MSQKVYVEQISESTVKAWLDAGQEFVSRKGWKTTQVLPKRLVDLFKEQYQSLLVTKLFFKVDLDQA